MEWGLKKAYDLYQSGQQPCPAGEKGEKEPMFYSEGPSTKQLGCIASYLQHSLLFQRSKQAGKVRSLALGDELAAIIPSTKHSTGIISFSPHNRPETRLLIIRTAQKRKLRHREVRSLAHHRKGTQHSWA